MSELASPPGFRRRLLRAQRAGRFLLLAFVVAGASGLLGGQGPLAGQRIAVGEQGSVSLPRFIRVQTPFTLVAERTSVRNEPWALVLSDALVRRLDIENIAPTPLASQWSAEGLSLRFAADTTHVSIRARSDDLGPSGGRIRMAGSEDTDLPLWTYP